MKVIVFVVLLAVSVNGDTYINSVALRNKGTTLNNVDASIKIGTPPAAYSKFFADDELATARLQQLLNILKRMFHVGIDPVPVLDPLRKEVLGPFNVNNILISGKVLLRNVVISGLKSMQVEDLLMRLHYDEQFRVDTNATIPSLTFEAELETNVKIQKIIPINVKGGISVVINNLKVTGAVGGKPVVLNDGKPVMKVDSVHGYGGADSAVVNLKFSGAVMKIIEGKGLGINMIYKVGKDEIGEAIGQTIIAEANDVLSKIALEQVQAYLVSPD